MATIYFGRRDVAIYRLQILIPQKARAPVRDQLVYTLYLLGLARDYDVEIRYFPPHVAERWIRAMAK